MSDRSADETCHVALRGNSKVRKSRAAPLETMSTPRMLRRCKAESGQVQASMQSNASFMCRLECADLVPSLLHARKAAKHETRFLLIFRTGSTSWVVRWVRAEVTNAYRGILSRASDVHCMRCDAHVMHDISLIRWRAPIHRSLIIDYGSAIVVTCDSDIHFE